MDDRSHDLRIFWPTVIAKIDHFEHFVRDVQLPGGLTPSADLIGTTRFGLSYYRRRGT